MQMYNHILYWIKNKFNLSLHNKTLRVIKKIKKEKSYKKQLIILERFLNVVKNSIPMDECHTADTTDFTSMENVINALEYYSDRWNMNRVNKVFSYVNKELH